MPTRVLALETATDACSVALGLDDVLHERHEVPGRGHARRILEMVQVVLDEAGLAPGDLDAVAFGRGPGAFTGLRVAAAAAQGIAFGIDRPVVPVSTLAALGRGAGRRAAAQNVLTALDARMGEVYWAAFELRPDGGVDPVGEERVCPPDQVTHPGGTGWLGAGPGWRVHGDTLGTCLGDAVTAVDPGALPRAGDVAALALLALARGETVAPEAAVPVYLRDRVTRAP